MAVYRENKRRRPASGFDPGQSAQNSQGSLRERNLVRDAILGPLFRYGPGLRHKVDFLPSRLADFAKPLARQQQQLRERPEWPADAFEGRPCGADFVVGQDTIAARLGGWGADLLTWARFDKASLDGPC